CDERAEPRLASLVERRQLRRQRALNRRRLTGGRQPERPRDPLGCLLGLVRQRRPAIANPGDQRLEIRGRHPADPTSPFLRIFPVAVFGSSGRKTISFGTMKFSSFAAHTALMSLSVSITPSSSATNALTAS